MCSEEQSSQPKIPYRCSFCREDLIPVELTFWSKLRCLLLVKPYQCPHCFEVFVKPLASLTRIPLLGRLLKGEWRRREDGDDVLPQRSGSISLPGRVAAGLGRVMRRTEEGIDAAFRLTYRGVRAAVEFIPRQLSRGRDRWWFRRR